MRCEPTPSLVAINAPVNSANGHDAFLRRTERGLVPRTHRLRPLGREVEILLRETGNVLDRFAFALNLIRVLADEVVDGLAGESHRLRIDDPSNHDVTVLMVLRNLLRC